MSDKKIKVQREVSEREVEVEREQTLVVNATGVFPSGTLEITENGEYDVKFYETAHVAVPTKTVEDFFTEQIVSESLANNVKKVEFHAISTSLSSLASLCQSKTSLEYADLSGCDTSRIRNYQYCFAFCPKLTYINISGWTNLNNSSTTGIFNSSRNIRTIIIDSPYVFHLTAAQTLPSTTAVYVPDSLVEDYKTDGYWSAHSDKIKPLSELPEEYRS